MTPEVAIFGVVHQPRLAELMWRLQAIALRGEPQPCEMAPTLLHVEPHINAGFWLMQSVKGFHRRLVMVKYDGAPRIGRQLAHHVARITEIQNIEDSPGHIRRRLPILHRKSLDVAESLASDPCSAEAIPALSVVEH